MFSTAVFHYRYTQNGLLHMLDRNRRIKEKPQRFQHNQFKFDVIITCEERVYDQAVECKPILFVLSIMKRTNNYLRVYLTV